VFTAIAIVAAILIWGTPDDRIDFTYFPDIPQLPELTKVVR
jgi:hypothetical protein